MRKHAVFREPGAVPVVPYMLSPGRQLSFGCDLEMARRGRHGLSVMSSMNVVVGAALSDLTGAIPVYTGNDAAGYPSGAEALARRRYPWLATLVERESPTTLASARNVPPLLRRHVGHSGLIEAVVVSDEPQGLRFADMLEDQEGIRVCGVAVAPDILATSEHPEDIALVNTYQVNRLYRHLEGAKQDALRRLDPHGTRIEGIARMVRPQPEPGSSL